MTLKIEPDMCVSLLAYMYVVQESGAVRQYGAEFEKWIEESED